MFSYEHQSMRLIGCCYVQALTHKLGHPALVPSCHAVLPELSRRSPAKRLLSGPGEASRVLLAHRAAIMSYPLLFCLIHTVTMSLGQGPGGEIHGEERGRLGTSPLGPQTLLGKIQP